MKNSIKLKKTKINYKYCIKINNSQIMSFNIKMNKCNFNKIIINNKIFYRIFNQTYKKLAKK